MRKGYGRRRGEGIFSIRIFTHHAMPVVTIKYEAIVPPSAAPSWETNISLTAGWIVNIIADNVPIHTKESNVFFRIRDNIMARNSAFRLTAAGASNHVHRQTSIARMSGSVSRKPTEGMATLRLRHCDSRQRLRAARSPRQKGSI